MRSPFRSLAFVAAFSILVFACQQDESPTHKNNSVNPNDFLSDATYSQLKIEIVYVEGYQPIQNSLTNLQSLLNSVLKKTSITYDIHSIPSPAKTTVTVDDLASIEDSRRQLTTGNGILTAYVLFVDGEYSQNTSTNKVLGVAYRNSSMAIFEKSLRAFAGGIGQPSLTTLETSVLEHEFGHILGLVNNGSSMVSTHQDSAHGAHCTNKDCLMYYLAESNAGLSNLTGGSVPLLDSNCLADLKANGGK